MDYSSYNVTLDKYNLIETFDLSWDNESDGWFGISQDTSGIQVLKYHDDTYDIDLYYSLLLGNIDEDPVIVTLADTDTDTFGSVSEDDGVSIVTREESESVSFAGGSEEVDTSVGGGSDSLTADFAGSSDSVDATAGIIFAESTEFVIKYSDGEILALEGGYTNIDENYSAESWEENARVAIGNMVSNALASSIKIGNLMNFKKVKASEILNESFSVLKTISKNSSNVSVTVNKIVTDGGNY